MKYKKSLAEYKQAYTESESHDVQIKYEDYLAELEYIAETEGCSAGDIKLVYVAAVGEIVIYVDGRFYGYMDRSLTNEMDLYNNSK